MCSRLDGAGTSCSGQYFLGARSKDLLTVGFELRHYPTSAYRQASAIRLALPPAAAVLMLIDCSRTSRSSG